MFFVIKTFLFLSFIKFDSIEQQVCSERSKNEKEDSETLDTKREVSREDDSAIIIYTDDEDETNELPAKIIKLEKADFNEYELPETFKTFNESNNYNLYKKPFTLSEEINLVYLVEKFGADWKHLSTDYKKYFQNRNELSLAEMYVKAQNNPSHYEYLRNMAECKLFDSLSEESKRNEWLREEMIYLVYGVFKFGMKWTTILEVFKQHFKADRKPSNLRIEYNKLEKNQSKFEYFQNQAILLIEEERTNN